MLALRAPASLAGSLYPDASDYGLPCAHREKAPSYALAGEHKLVPVWAVAVALATVALEVPCPHTPMVLSRAE